MSWNVFCHENTSHLPRPHGASRAPLGCPIVLDATSKNITIQFDLSTWFKSGTTVINPATANAGGANENVVRNNIRASLRAIEDDDKNGH